MCNTDCQAELARVHARYSDDDLIDVASEDEVKIRRDEEVVPERCDNVQHSILHFVPH